MNPDENQTQDQEQPNTAADTANGADTQNDGAADGKEVTGDAGTDAQAQEGKEEDGAGEGQ